MSDTPTPPAGDAEGGAAGGAPEGAGDETPWYSKPTTWVALVLLLAALVVVFLVANDDDSGSNDIATPSSSSTTSSTISSTTSSSTTSTSVPEGTSPTTAGDTEGTDTGEAPGVTPVAISESAVKAAIAKNTPDVDLPFEDGDIEANWYTWEDRFVVVYAGWDATAIEPLCPGNSLESGGAFEFISNSPAGDGGCDPEDAFSNLVTGDEGARVCEGLVLYRTIIPTVDDAGEPATGTLYGSIEKADGDTVVGATSRAALDSGELTELDFTADAYTVPDGWLDGTTEVTC